MRNVGMTIWVAVSLVYSLVSSARAYIDFDSGKTETIAYDLFDEVRVDYNAGNISGTHLILESGASISGCLNAYNGSQITLRDGIVRYDVRGYGNSTLTISGGTVEDDVISWDNSQILITGNANVSFILANDNSNIHINGGTIKYHIEAYHDSSIYISGGKFTKGLYAIENGIVTLEGTNFAIRDINRTVSTQVNGFLNIPELVNAGVLLHDAGDSYDAYVGVLTGQLADGTSISSIMQIVHRQQDGVLMNGANFYFAPEPATLSLLAFGGLAMRRRRSS